MIASVKYRETPGSAGRPTPVTIGPTHPGPIGPVAGPGPFTPPRVIDELRRTLSSEIPVTRQLGIVPRSVDARQVTLAAPLAANHNHTGTAFAGSINALATLAGWSMMWMLLRHHEFAGHVLLQDSTISYLRPVRSDFHASCGAPDAPAVERFLAALRRRGRGRLALRVTVSDAQGPAANFSGRYVAYRETNAPAGSILP